MTYPLSIAVGLLLWVAASLVEHRTWSIGLRVLAAAGFGVAVLEAAGVVK